MTAFIGKRLVQILATNSDEGFVLVFEDGSRLDVGFSSGYGEIKAWGADNQPIRTRAANPWAQVAQK